ncbi:MAG: hypothetical protein ACKOU6_15650 [Planctomycetota bacterium]
MGMDVWGRNPSAPAGRYFRANIWSWFPDQLSRCTIRRLAPESVAMTKLGFNVGAGLADAPTCQQMANRFECWLEHHTAGHGIDLGLRVTYDGRFVSDEELSKRPDLETMSPYQVDDEHLKQWVEFLRHCGGFEVW